MSQSIQVHGILAPGFMGLNTQDSSFDLKSGFALVANNCVIDKYGRIGARKGWTDYLDTTANTAGGAVGSIGQLISGNNTDGVGYIIFGAANKIFSDDGDNTYTELTYGGGGTAPTITGNKWNWVSLNGVLYGFQLGHDPIVYDPNVSQSTYRRVSEKTGTLGTIPVGDVVLSAYGRLWVAHDNVYNSDMKFSDLLNGHIYSGGSSGTLDIAKVWPDGMDQIVALAAHNGFLFIFGKKQIVIYQGANDPSTMSLADSISGIGCISRDSVIVTGTDVIFLSDTGLRSIRRTIQEKSAPLGDLSRNVRDDLGLSITGAPDLANVHAVYDPKNAYYLLSFPSQSTLYCFDTRMPMQDGALRATVWTGLSTTCMRQLRSGSVLFGLVNHIGLHEGYLDNATMYRLEYFTNWADLGQPDIASILKRYSAIIIGGTTQSISMKWAFDFKNNYGVQTVLLGLTGASVAEWGIAEYAIAEYGSGIGINTLTSYPTGTGKVCQFGIEADINGISLSVQKIEIHAKQGKVQ